MKNQVCIVACCKREERYIIEWIEHNIKIGVDHFYIADNNDKGFIIDLADILKDYIDKGIVTLFNYQGVDNVQIKCYDQIYKEFKDKNEWFLFIDVDEFIEIPETNNDIKKFLSLPKFNKYNNILINWVVYDDNELLYYEDKPVQERFTRVYVPKDSFHTYKSFVRGGLDIRPSIHIMHGKEIRSCTVDGNAPALNGCTCVMYDHFYKIAYLKHYMYKSAEEFLFRTIYKQNTEIKRSGLRRFNVNAFFNVNRKTKEKEIILHSQDDLIRSNLVQYICKLLDKSCSELKNVLQDQDWDKVIDRSSELSYILTDIRNLFRNESSNNSVR